MTVSYAGIGAAAAATASEHQKYAEDSDTSADLRQKSQRRRAQKLTKHKLRGKLPLLVRLSMMVW